MLGLLWPFQLHFFEPLFGPPWAGSAVMVGVGLVGLIQFLRKRRGARTLWLALAAFAVDNVVTVLLVWPMARPIDPFAAWPYVAGTLSTVLAGICLGAYDTEAVDKWLACVGFVSLDFAISGLLSPLAFTPALLSRIPVAYLGAAVGVMVGRSIKRGISNEGSLAKPVARDGLLPLAVTVIGGVAVEAIIRMLLHWR